MSEPLGALCLVLHGHLPYVLHHGVHPHGEAWLYEAAAETYLPLLEAIGEVALHKQKASLTIGLTPILLEQLAHEQFKTGFVRYLTERIARAQKDEKGFAQQNESTLVALAQRWQKWYAQRLEHFEKLDRDIPGEFARLARDEQIQILTSNATHCYMPLTLRDESLRAQMTCGVMTSEKHLGFRPRGMWLPECAYRPANAQWKPVVVYDDARPRPGIETFIADSGITHFFVDSHTIGNGQPLGVIDSTHFRPISDAEIHWDARRAWRSPLEPVGVSSDAHHPRCFAMARHPRVSEQVWSSVIGYPGSGEYLEFHRKHGENGLRYHRVTNHHTALHEKHPYVPEDVFSKLYEHATHFCKTVREVLIDHHTRTGRAGVCVATFDAELFGHWWFEGISFLRNVIFTLANDPTIQLLTAEQALEQHPPDKVMRLPGGSWGEGGGHSVWLNEQTRWIWEIEYRAETRFLKQLHALSWQTDTQVKQLLTLAARELLLLQASDWPFVIHSKSAIDYGIQRFTLHATRFDRLITIAEQLATGAAPSAIQQSQIEEAELHDTVFNTIDLTWWT